MSNFDQTQADLSAFLDNQFANEQPVQEEVSSHEERDDEIEQFLQGDDEETGLDTTAQQQQVANVNTGANKPLSPDDRVLQLERELAAERTRAQMYENVLAGQYNQAISYQQQEQQTLPNVVFNDQELAVDERYEQDYGDANPYIASIAKRVANDLYQRTVVPLQHELQNVRGQLQSQQQFNHTQRTDTLHMQLKSVVPDIDELVRTPEWQSYIKQPDLYGSGRTIASYVQEGIQYGNVRQLAQIVNQFKQSQTRAKPQQNQVAPGRAQVGMPNTNIKRGKVLNMSDFDLATTAFQTGKLSWDKYQEVANEFNAAMLDGRVNHNK